MELKLFMEVYSYFILHNKRIHIEIGHTAYKKGNFSASILPKNKLENVNFSPSLLGQKFFINFFGKLKTKQKVLLKLTHLNFLLEVTPVLNLERCPNQLSNFGELSKSALQIWLPSDF